MSASANVTPAAPAARSGTPPWTPVVVALTALLAVGIGGVLASFLMTNRAAPGTFALADSVPADAPIVYELRLDLPAGQGAALQQLLGHFPAAASDAIADGTLERWIDDQLEATGVPYRYATDVKPWFDGRVTFALLDLGSEAGGGAGVPAPGMGLTSPRYAAVIGSGDPQATGTFLEKVRADLEGQGLSFRSETHEGVEVWSQTEPDPFSGMAFSWALDGDGLILAGDAADVRRVLDVRAGRAASLAASDDYRRLTASLAPDAAASFFMNTDALVGSVVEQWRSMPGLEAFVPVYERLVAAASTATAASLRIEPNGIRGEMIATIPEDVPVASNAERGLDGQVPGDAILFADGGRVGQLLAWYITTAKEAMPDAVASPEFNRQTIADAEAALGEELEAFVSWIDDAAFVAGWDGEQPYGGVILTTDEPDAARQRIGQLRALAELGAAQAGLTFAEEEVAGVEVVTIRFPLDDSTEMPIEPVVQYAIDERRVLIGVGDRFVGRALQLAPESSLAASDRYRSARDAAGPASNQGVAWLDLVALREAIEPNLPPDVRTMYDEFVAAWVEPLDYLVAVTRQEGDVSLSVSHFRVR